MKNRLSGFITLLIFIFWGFSLLGIQPGRKIIIKTSYGEMKAILYDDTPLHRDNFMKLAKEGYYNGLLFHRVIKDFMVQGGDPESKKATPGQRLGSGGPGYQIPAEIIPIHFHKKGALAAARTGDNANPERKSSGSQFYIVQGKVWTRNELVQFQEKQKYQAIRSEGMRLLNKRQAEIIRLQQEGKTDSANAIMLSVQVEAEKIVEKQNFSISEEQMKAYTTVGGTPHLDGSYTVFGEIIEGFNVLDSITAVQTAPGDRPLINIEMEIEVIE